MEKFLFIIREDLNILKDYTEEARQRGMVEMTRWVETLAESWSYVGGEPLAITGRYVNKEVSSRTARSSKPKKASAATS
jgi:hypothetical protein